MTTIDRIEYRLRFPLPEQHPVPERIGVWHLITGAIIYIAAVVSTGIRSHYGQTIVEMMQ